MAPTIPQQSAGSMKVTIYHAVTGEPIQRWPVDAGGMIACGEYLLAPPVVEAAPETVTEADIQAGWKPAETASEQPEATVSRPSRLHPLNTPEVAVPIVLGAAGKAAPVQVPPVGAKRVGKARKFPTE